MLSSRVLCPSTKWRKNNNWSQILFYVNQNIKKEDSFTAAEVLKSMKAVNCEVSTFYYHFNKMSQANLFTPAADSDNREKRLVLSDIGKECAECEYARLLHNEDYACSYAYAYDKP